MRQTQIDNLLRALGIGRQYCGYRLTIEAMHLLCQDEDRLLCIKSGILQPLADQFQCDWRSVERNLRTVICRAWRRNATLLTQMAAYPLLGIPTVTEFLDILASYLMRQRTSEYCSWS